MPTYCQWNWPIINSHMWGNEILWGNILLKQDTPDNSERCSAFSLLNHHPETSGLTNNPTTTVRMCFQAGSFGVGRRFSVDHRQELSIRAARGHYTLHAASLRSPLLSKKRALLTPRAVIRTSICKFVSRNEFRRQRDQIAAQEQSIAKQENAKLKTLNVKSCLARGSKPKSHGH